MFNPFAQMMMLVFTAAGMALAYLEAKHRPDWWVQGIKLYVLPLYAWAAIGVAHFGSVPIPDGCNSRCLMTAAPARLMETYIRMGGVLLVGLIYLAALTAVRRYWNQLAAWCMDWIGNTYKPDKWHVDPQTGQTYKIKASHRGHIRYETDNYAKRIMNEWDELEKLKGARVMAWLCWAGLFAQVTYTAFHDGYFAEIFCWIMLGIAVLSTVMLLFQGSVRMVAARNVGPAPFKPAEDTSVEDQHVHDTGGMMDNAELDAALRGDVRTSKPIRPRPRSA